jgi:hypothetical protein
MNWLFCSLVLLAAGDPAAENPAVPPAESPAALADSERHAPSVVQGTQWQATSENFTVRNQHPSHDARQIAEHCERWRTKLQKYWTASRQPAWSSRCEVVVHANSASYLSVVGQGGRQTFGSSLVKFAPDKTVAKRLIDFRGDHVHGLAAVPHEMTHIVLADLLDGRQPPRWADEGMAILADSHEKQLLHERDLTQGLSARIAFRVTELMSVEAYPHPSRMAAFYGQSASLTACLAKRDDPARFVEFLRRSLDDGYDKALRDVYHLQNIAELEKLWHEQRIAWRGGYHGVRLAIDEAATSHNRLAE